MPFANRTNRIASEKILDQQARKELCRLLEGKPSDYGAVYHRKGNVAHLRINNVRDVLTHAISDTFYAMLEKKSIQQRLSEDAISSAGGYCATGSDHGCDYFVIRNYDLGIILHDLQRQTGQTR